MDGLFGGGHGVSKSTRGCIGGGKQPDWQELVYPGGHPYSDNPIDLAFIITTDDYCPARADLNCDGFVDLLDFAIFAAQWLQTTP